MAPVVAQVHGAAARHAADHDGNLRRRSSRSRAPRRCATCCATSPASASRRAKGGGGLPGDNLAIRGFAARNDIFVDGVRDFGAYSRDPFNIEQVEVVEGSGLALHRPRLDRRLAQPGEQDAAPGGGPQRRDLGAGTDEYGRATVDVNQPIEGLGTGAAFRVNAMWTHADTPGPRRRGERALGHRAVVRLRARHADARDAQLLATSIRTTSPTTAFPGCPPPTSPWRSMPNKPAPVDFDNFYGLTDRDYEKTVTGHRHRGGRARLQRFAHPAQPGAPRPRRTRDSIITAPRFASNDSTTINRQFQSRDLDGHDPRPAERPDLPFRAPARSPRAGGRHRGRPRDVGEPRPHGSRRRRTADLFNPNPERSLHGLRSPAPAPAPRATADTVALYASDTVQLSEKWEVIGGLRWDHFDVDYRQRGGGPDGFAFRAHRRDAELAGRRRPQAACRTAASTPRPAPRSIPRPRATRA